MFFGKKERYIQVITVSICLLIFAFSFLGFYELKAYKEFQHLQSKSLQHLKERTLSLNSQENDFLNLFTQEVTHRFDKSGNQQFYFFITLLFSILLLIGLLVYVLKNYIYLKQHFHSYQFNDLLYKQQLAQIPDHLHWKEMVLNEKQFIREIKHAISHHHFVIHYQPILSIGSKKIIGAEALIRWLHPKYGLLTPNTFLPLCEIAGQMPHLFDWMLDTICKEIQQWHQNDLRFYIAINVSSSQLNHPLFYATIESKLKQYNIPFNCIHLELTESTLIEDVKKNISLLKQLRILGIRLALDDFGTGFSSINHVKQLPIDTLKIDRSFIADIDKNIVTQSLTESIIKLGKNLGLTLIAEGIETNSQLHLLKTMECDAAQGFLFYKPMPATQLTELFNHPNNNVRYIKKTHDDLQFEILQEKHLAKAISLFTSTFCHYEPMTKYLTVSEEEFRPFAEAVIKKAIQDKLSVAAVQHEALAAIAIVEDLTNPCQVDIAAQSKLTTIFALIGTLSEQYFKDKTISAGHIAHLFITAVDNKFAGLGLSRAVNLKATSIAKQSGFEFMCCDFTNIHNEKGTIHHLLTNKKMIGHCWYKDFYYQGKKPFENLDGYASAYLWELRDSALLDFKWHEAVGDNF